MNVQMWSNAATRRNVAQLATDGVTILGPGSGELACLEYGDGRMLGAEELHAALHAFVQPK
jgi:phosphopantothenoylcysteine decarboxylase/phosphopantothenate--cysteine ligase